MKQNGLEPNNLTFPSVAKACGKLLSLYCTHMLHTHVAKSPFQSDKVVILFCQMKLEGIRPDSVTVMGLTPLGSCMKDHKWVNVIHCFGIQTGVDSDVLVANTWIAASSKCGDLGLAEMVFGGIGSGLRIAVSWNSMLSGYAHVEKLIKAIGLYKQMLSDGFGADVSTILSLLASCGGIVDSAQYVFDSMINRTCVLWTAIIDGYAAKVDLDEALALFHSMEASCQKPNIVTVLYRILDCGQTGGSSGWKMD
ncbi:pentatricopeptide repeat-containing protein At4g19191, mitochondrial-like [Actinidia eriantha]|uniref:pentatricopeptide repeat-containing protein At4g19191, mitochondrial-like n=1 Tax=Actinidia eriantha TaxID=165200 RepID=UPI00258F8880|nr:pentatricopeptide repeat-containing protein At4g19191, mitochondrial-like [Actinidia eriantha]